MSTSPHAVGPSAVVVPSARGGYVEDRAGHPLLRRLHGLLPTLGPVAAGLLATGLVLYNLSKPGGLHDVVQYDDGVYFGAAVRLIEGKLAYRDFVFVQPPGIAVLAAPVAFLTHAAGTQVGLAWARVLTAGVTGLDAWLVGRLLRHKGAATATLGALVLAVFPAAFFADRTLMLEPYMVGLCLLGLNICFVRGELGGGRRLVLGGVLFGMAGATKTWAIVVVAALALALVGRARGSEAAPGAFGLRGRVVPLAAGTVLGFALVCLPFFVAAPGAFYHDVVVSQLGRHGAAPSPTWQRLAVIVGLQGVSGVGASEALTFEIVVGLVLVLVLFSLVPTLAGRGSRFERFALLATAGSVAALLVPTEFFYHYAYFAIPFLALALGCALDRAGRLARGVLGRGGGPWRSAIGRTVAVALGFALVAGLVWLAPNEARYGAASIAPSGDPALAIDLAVPARACILSDAAILLVEANRLTGAQHHCPQLLDATALWLAVAPNESPTSCAPVPATLVADWRSWFAEADFFVESSSGGRRVPWTVGLRRWFAAHYRQIPDPGVGVFVRLDTPYAASALDPSRWTPARLAAEGLPLPLKQSGPSRVAPPKPCLLART